MTPVTRHYYRFAYTSWQPIVPIVLDSVMMIFPLFRSKTDYALLLVLRLRLRPLPYGGQCRPIEDGALRLRPSQRAPGTSPTRACRTEQGIIYGKHNT